MNTLKKYSDEIQTNTDLSKYDKILLSFLNNNSGGYLGDPVLNDGCMFARNMTKLINIKCFHRCNATVETAKELFKKALENTGTVYIYYSGHGTQRKDIDGDEEDGKDEAFVFKDGVLLDDDIAIMINNMKCAKLVCIADSCHCGTVWDSNKFKDEIKNKVICISSCMDNQTSKQLIKNGCFTLQFWQLYDATQKKLNLKELNRRLDLFDQRVITYGDYDNWI